jgi:hypothetical protein
LSDDGKAAEVSSEKDIFLTIAGRWFSHLAIFGKPMARAIQAFCAIVQWRRRGPGYCQSPRRELDAFIRFAIETLPQSNASPEEARAVLIAEGIITADGELAAEYRPAGDRCTLLFLKPPTFSAGSAT